MPPEDPEENPGPISELLRYMNVDHTWSDDTPGDPYGGPGISAWQLGESPGGVAASADVGKYFAGELDSGLFCAWGVQSALAASSSELAMTLFHGGDVNSQLVEVCFAAGTPVLMADGTTKPIEQIRPGDLVLSVPDGDPTAPAEPKPVVEVYHNPPAELLTLKIGDQELRCTPTHRFYVEGKGWTAAKDLLAGDRFRTPDGKPAKLASISEPSLPEPVFNFQVSGNHTYLVGGKDHAAVLVHNEGCGNSTTSSWDFQTVADIIARTNPWLAKEFEEKGQIIGDSHAHWYQYAFTRWDYPYLEVNLDQANLFVARIIAHVPPNWTSEQVAQFILEKARGNDDLARAMVYEGMLVRGATGIDAVMQLQLKERVQAYRETCTQIAAVLEGLVEFGVSLMPGGMFVISVNDAFEGRYVSAAVGAIFVIPWAKLGEAANAMRIAFKDGKEVVFGKETIQVLRSMGQAERAAIGAEIAAAKTAREVEVILAKAAQNALLVPRWWSSLWGRNRLVKELYERGFRFIGETTSGGGFLYRNLRTGEEVRIMPNPSRPPFRTEPSSKFMSDWYFRYRSGLDQPWGPHVSLPGS